MKSFFKRPLLCCLFFLVFIITSALVALPSILSTQWGTQAIVKSINSSIPGSIQIEKINLSWRDQQKISGIELLDINGEKIVKINEITLADSLWNILIGQSIAHPFSIKELNATLESNLENQTNIQRALGSIPHTTLIDNSSRRIRIHNLNADFMLLNSDAPLSISLNGKTDYHNEMGNVNLEIVFHGLYPKKWSSFKDEILEYLRSGGLKTLYCRADVSHFPISLLDQFIRIPGLNGTFFTDLLGSEINASLAPQPNTNTIFAFNCSSPNLKTKALFELTDSALKILSPSFVALDLHPSLFRQINPKIAIDTPAKCQIDLQAFELPFSSLFSHDSLLRSWESAGEMVVMPFNLAFENEKISELSGTIHWKTLAEKHILLESKIQGEYKEKPFLASGNTEFNLPLSNLPIDGDFHLKNFPIALSALFHPSKQLESLIGPSLNLDASFKAKDTQHYALLFSAHSPLLVIEQAKFLISSQVVSIKSPFSLSYSIPHQQVKSTLTSDDTDFLKPISLVITQLNLPLNGKELDGFRLESSLKTATLLKELELRSFQLSAQPNGGKLNVKLSGDIYSTNDPLLKDPLKITLLSIMNIKDSSPFKLIPLGLTLKNALLDLNLNGQIADFKEFQLTNPLTATLVLTPSLWSHYIKQHYAAIAELKDNSLCHLSLDPFKFLLSNPTENMNLKGNLKIDHFSLMSKPSLNKLNAVWNVNAATQSIDLNAAAFVGENSESNPAQISLETHIDHFEFTKSLLSSQLKIEAYSQLTAFPTSLVSLFINQPDLSPLLGNTLDVNLKLAFDKSRKSPGYLDFVIDSRELHGRARLKIDKAITLYESNKPTVEFKLNLTPEAYSHLRKIKPNLSLPQRNLAEPISLMLMLKQLNIPFEEAIPHYLNSQFELESVISDLRWDSSPKNATFNMTTKLSTTNFSDACHFNINGDIGQTQLVAQGNVQNFLNKQGVVKPFDQMDLAFNGHAKHFPIDGTLGLVPANIEAQLNAIFGHHADLTFNLSLSQLNGPVKMTVNGTEGSLNLDGTLKDGFLLLNTPLQMTVKITESFKMNFLEKNNLLKNIIEAKNPAKIIFEPDQFKIPVFPYRQQDISIGKGTLDLGQIVCKNAGELLQFTNLIFPLNQDVFTIWFTPLHFSILQGIVDLKRCDILISNRYTLAFWGKDNLMKNEGDLILGIPNRTLQFAFNLPDLNENYMLHIPFKIRKGHLELDKGLLTGRISALMAQSHTDSQIKWIGTAIDMAMTKGFDSTTPEPTTYPFPWGTIPEPQKEKVQKPPSIDEEMPEETYKSKKKKDKKKALINELEKEAGSLLRQILS